MESRFAHLRQRDASVSMLRVKLSRRRSQSQKENREKAVNTRRQLDQVPELDVSCMDASMANVSTIKDVTQNNAKAEKISAVEERLKQLERWKERKALEKEKDKREKERKGVFKTGLYHPKDALVTVSLPAVPAVPKRTKETKVNIAPTQTTRVTRSMKQQHVQQPRKIKDPNTVAKKDPAAVERSTRGRVAPVKVAPASSLTKNNVCAVEPVVRALSTRSANRPPVTAPIGVKDKPAADVRATRSRAITKPVAPPLGKERKGKAPVKNTVQPPVPKEPESKEPERETVSSASEEEDMVVDHNPADVVAAEDPFEEPSSLSSFAPQGFVFQAPAGLSSFKFQPLTPRSADAFLTPSTSFNLPPVPLFTEEPEAETSQPSPPKSPRSSPPCTSSTITPASPLESKHDVAYFRSEIANETDQLTAQCSQWECKVEDESIPEEMRDRMRTAVGQARLLMKERFKQFGGLVDDCELGRGDKVTTCTDLQGFWDMVYYQVEDVNRKFEALKEAEGRGWVEEHKPLPRPRKTVKKPTVATAKPTGTKAAGAKSRLAAAKAAMKAQRLAAEAEKAAQDAGKSGDGAPEPRPQTEAPPADGVVFDGGFFQVQSPARASGSVRRSSRLSAAVPPQAASPCTGHLTPRRVTRRSLAMAHTPARAAAASPAKTALTPAVLRLTLGETPKGGAATPRPFSRGREAAVEVSLRCPPLEAELAGGDRPEGGSPVKQTEAEVAASAPEPSQVRPVPSINVVEEEVEEPAGAAAAAEVFPASPGLALTPRRTPLPVAQEPEAASLSFTLSPCGGPSPPGPSPHNKAEESMCFTPESSVVEEIPGLDFERYLQPSLRRSLSPRETVAAETQSPVALDVEMESPGGQGDHLLARPEPALPAVSSLFALQSPQVQTEESTLLLFTPDLKDRIRQSVCPRDLMVFTPPSNE